MRAQITVPFEELQQKWREQKAPVILRKTSQPDWVTIVPKRGATQEEVEIFFLGHALPH